MRKLIVTTYATLDGHVGDLQDWGLPFDHEATARYHGSLLKNCDGLLLGRRTYQLFAVIWPGRAGLAYVDKLNSLPKYVASSTLTELPWHNSQLLEGDAVAAVGKLKEQPGGDLVAYGGESFTAALLEAGLVDEYRVLVSPVLLGKEGPRLFEPGSCRVDLTLAEATVMGPGVAALTYCPSA